MSDWRSDTVLLQQADGWHTEMLRAAHDLHASYCERHKIDYRPFFGPVDLLPEGRHPVWGKVALLRKYADNGYKKIIWLDADCLIVDQDADIRDACPDYGIGLTRHEMDWGRLAPQAYDHFNAGCLFVSIAPVVRDFIERWWDWPEHDHQWREQHSLNEMIKLIPGLVVKIDHKYNSTPPYFEAPVKEEVVRAWHGLFEKERIEVMKSAIADLQSGGVGHESAYWRARIRSEEQFRELIYDLRKEKDAGKITV